MMVRTREENAAEMARDELVREMGDDAIRQEPGLVPEEEIDYGEWLEWTGRDDSFVGDGRTVPGTGDVYDAAIRAFRVRMAAPAP